MDEDYGNDRSFIIRRHSDIYCLKTWTKRERVFFALNCVILFIVIILIFILGFSKKSLKNSNTGSTQVCLTGECLKQALFLVNNMNITADPCEDFYSYACGRFSTTYPPHQDYFSFNIYKLIEKNYYESLKVVLEKELPPNKDYPNSSVKKLNNFYGSCLYRDDLIKANGDKLIKIIDEMGGWEVLGSWNTTKFNRTELLVKSEVHWSEAFFKAEIHFLRPGSQEHFILIEPARPARYSQFLISKEVTIYKKFIKNLCLLLIRDANVSFTAEQNNKTIDKFINDVLDMEEQLINKTKENIFKRSNETIISIGEMDKKFPEIKWLSFFKSLFDDQIINESTLIHCEMKNCITDLPQIMTSSTPEMYYNYIIWRIIFFYARHLSFEYIHAYIVTWPEIVYDFKNLAVNCIKLMHTHMGDVLDALYFEEFIEPKNIVKAKDMENNLRQSLLTVIDKFSWMDESTKSKAKAKVKNIASKIGFKSTLKNRTTLDLYYNQIQIDPIQYFDNYVNLNKFSKHSYNPSNVDLYSNAERKRLQLYKLVSELPLEYFESYLPLPYFHFPSYDTSYPYFMFYGTLGFLIAKNMITLMYKSDDFTSWSIPKYWSIETNKEFTKRLNCVHNLLPQTNISIDVHGTTETVLFTAGAHQVSLQIELMFEMKQVYEAYKILLKDQKDFMLPGLALKSYEQAIFVSLMQMNCFSERPDFTIFLANKVNLHSPTSVAKAVAQIPEFSEAFACSSSSKARKDKSCQII